jgi:hypothetical protein
MIRTEWQADAEYFALPPHTGPLPTAEEIEISNALNEYVAAVAARNACLKIMGTLNRAKKAGKTWAEVTNRDIYRAISGRAPYYSKDIRVDNKFAGYDFWRAELGSAQRRIIAANRKLKNLGV